MPRKLFSLFLISIFLLSGCDFSIAEPVPTPFPEEYIPTLIALTSQAASTPPQPGATTGSPITGTVSTLTPTPLPSTLTPTPTETLTPTPTLSLAPPEGNIRIVAPGPMSKVTSPLHMIAYVIPGGKDRYQIELLGEDGRLLTRKVDVYPAPAYSPWVYVALDIPFEIPVAAELARLQISTLDDFGRPQGVMSVHLLLQSSGRNVINPSGGTGERAWLNYPLPGEQAMGGEVPIAGKLRPFNDEKFVIELINQSGQVIGARVLELDGKPEAEGYIPFSTTIPYNVSETTSARLVIRQTDDRIPGLMYLYSTEITLNP